jgi:protein gp37
VDGSKLEPDDRLHKVSPGCAHCYAETFAERWRGVPGHPYEPRASTSSSGPSAWTSPALATTAPDLRQLDVRPLPRGIPDDFIAEVFEVMGRAHWHTFQILTKRHARLLELAPALDWHPNVWMGVSIENRRFVDRADYLREVQQRCASSAPSRSSGRSTVSTSTASTG